MTLVKDVVRFEEYYLAMYMINSNDELMQTVAAMLKEPVNENVVDFDQRQEKTKKEGWYNKIKPEQRSRETEDFTAVESWQWL